MELPAHLCQPSSRPSVPADLPLPGPRLKHPLDKCGPAGNYSALLLISCKIMIVKTYNQIWMYRYYLPEINILCLMSYVNRCAPNCSIPRTHLPPLYAM